MRIIEYPKNTRSSAYRTLWVLGSISACFSMVVATLLIANNLRLQATDPVHTPALQRLVQELKATPQNEALKEQIRELDWLARRAFFTHQHFNQFGAWLLLGGLVVSVVAFKTLAAYHRATPFPNPDDPADDLAANARWARQSITAVGLVLAGLALSLALPWKSPLDRPPADLASATAPGPAASRSSLRPTSAPSPDANTHPFVRAQHWPSFRGPASGHSPALTLGPWDGAAGTGIVWKTALPLSGFGSPILCRGRIFLSGGDAKKRAIYAIDARRGQIEWERPVPAESQPPAPVPEVMADTGYAAPTMATDGTRVFAIFATGELAAFDFDGRPIWSESLGTPMNPYGHSSSLEVFEDLVLVQYDQKTNGFIAALDTRTGQSRWRWPRNLGPSWASPIVISNGPQPELILVADAFVTAHDPRTGRELWRVQALANADVAPSPVFDGGRIFVAADHVRFAAIDAAQHRLLWETKETTPGVGTPVVVGDSIFAGLSEGSIACWDANSGTLRWKHETDDGFYASPIAAGSVIYVSDRTGRTFIFHADGAAYREIGQAQLGEECVATPAVFEQSLIVRGVKHLYRIGAVSN